MNSEVQFQKLSGKIHGGKRRNSPDRARSRAIEARADRRTVRQEMQRGAYLMVDDSADDGEE